MVILEVANWYLPVIFRGRVVIAFNINCVVFWLERILTKLGHAITTAIFPEVDKDGFGLFGCLRTRRDSAIHIERLARIFSYRR